MKHYAEEIILVLAVLTVSWGVFLVEDGLFNTGSPDMKEFSIGLGFIVSGMLVATLMSYRKCGFFRISPSIQFFISIVFIFVYAAATYSRWQKHDGLPRKISGVGMIVAHVRASNEWVMVHKSTLKRSAHWYESWVQVSYLGRNAKQTVSIQLPAKHVSLKSIKEAKEIKYEDLP